jgi:hypothetical protein
MVVPAGIAGAPKPLFQTRPEFHRRTCMGTVREYDATPDGQRFLVNQRLPDSGESPITGVVNWPKLLAKRTALRTARAQKNQVPSVASMGHWLCRRGLGLWQRSTRRSRRGGRRRGARHGESVTPQTASPARRRSSARCPGGGTGRERRCSRRRLWSGSSPAVHVLRRLGSVPMKAIRTGRGSAR